MCIPERDPAGFWSTCAWRIIFAFHSPYCAILKNVLRTCVVAFVDHYGVKHSVEVTAESVFEAAASGLKAISESWAEEPGMLTPIEIRVTAPVVRHELTLQALKRWLSTDPESRNEALLRQRVKTLLPG